MSLLLNVQAEELPALEAAMEVARQAASGYSVRAHPGRDIISQHWGEFNRLYDRVKALEAQREFHMTRDLKDAKYIHVKIDETVHERLYEYVRRNGGGKVQQGSLGHIVERALTEYMDHHHVPQADPLAA